MSTALFLFRRVGQTTVVHLVAHGFFVIPGHFHYICLLSELRTPSLFSICFHLVALFDKLVMSSLVCGEQITVLKYCGSAQAVRSGRSVLPSSFSEDSNDVAGFF